MQFKDRCINSDTTGLELILLPDLNITHHGSIFLDDIDLA